MTNREKFEEIFGLQIDDFPAAICRVVDRSIYENNICNEECPAFKFWDREWKRRNNSNDRK